MIPAESERGSFAHLYLSYLSLYTSFVDIPIVLGQGDGQAGQFTQPVTLYLSIIVPGNMTSPVLPSIIPTEGDDAPAGEALEPTTAPDSEALGQSTEPEHPLPPPGHLPVEGVTPMSQDRGEKSPVEEAQIKLDLAEQAKKLIDRSNTWGGVVGRIKWVMDTLSPVAGVRVIFDLLSFELTEPTARSQLHPIAQMAYSVLSVIPQVHLFASFVE